MLRLGSIMALILLIAQNYPAVPLRAQSPTPAAVDPLETRVKLAETLLNARRYDEAIAEFRAVLQARPGHRDAVLGATRAYFWSGRVREAIELLKPLIGATPDLEVTALWNELMGASGDTLLALRSLRERLAAHPEDLRLRQSLARLLIETGCYSEAIALLREAVRRHPADAELALDLALAYYTGDMDPEALAVATRYTTAPGTTGQRARQILARLRMRSWQLDQARALLEQMTVLDVADPTAWLGLIRIELLGRQADADRIQNCLRKLDAASARKLLHTDADVRDWLFALVGTLVCPETGPATADTAPAEESPATFRRDLALQLATLLEVVDPPPATRLCQQALRQYAEAGSSGVAVDIEPILAGVRAGTVERGMILEACSVLLYLYQGEQLAALAEAALEREPNDVAVMLYRAEGLAVRDRPEYVKAYEQYLRILDLLPECTKARRGAARVYSWYRMFKEAGQVYDELSERDPADMAIRREQARSLGWDKQIRLSLEAYEAAAATLGEEPFQQEWKQRLELERAAKKAFWWGRDVEAVEQYSRLIDLEPANLEARFDLAQVYARRRHWEEAADQYLEILRVDARHRRSRDALYKNRLYHRPELRVEYDWTREAGRGTLVDRETSRLTETLKQEIALRTDFSWINTQKWHYFRQFGGRTVDEYDVMGRIDHVFDLQTRGYLAAGYANLVGSDLENRFIGDTALTHDITDDLGITVGAAQRPWIRNYKTTKLGMDETRMFVRLFGDIDPWLDWFTEYGRSWIDKGTWKPSADDRSEVSRSNALDELLWGFNYRLSLFPRILQFEYRGYAWWYEREVPAYWSPYEFFVNTFRLGWRHYLNTDQYVEQKQFYYELGITGSVDGHGVGGIGYDAALGWDLSHHFGFELKWNQFCSSVYESRTAYVCLVGRF